MIIFENRAWEDAKVFRLRNRGNFIVEIGQHYTSQKGHIIISEDKKNTIVKDFSALKKYIERKFGKSNINKFQSLIEKSIEVMLQNKYVRKWKGLKEV